MIHTANVCKLPIANVTAISILFDNLETYRNRNRNMLRIITERNLYGQTSFSVCIFKDMQIEVYIYERYQFTHDK
jgi:hypothetical protein